MRVGGGVACRAKTWGGDRAHGVGTPVQRHGERGAM